MKRNKILYSISIILILAGIWLVTENMYHYSIGFSALATTSTPVPEDVGENNPTTTSPNEQDTNKLFTTIMKKNTNDHQNLTKVKSVLYPESPRTGDIIGELYIPKLGATLPIYHGTSEKELEKGVGHFADSVLPGENDNSVLSGHRDTVFRKLGEVGEGDKLIVSTSAGKFEYTINKVRIVDKDDRTVIVPKPRATLTVSTCYPFNFIGSAPKRYVLVAYLSSETLN